MRARGEPSCWFETGWRLEHEHGALTPAELHDARRRVTEELAPPPQTA
jgi:hypothetical protein